MDYVLLALSLVAFGLMVRLYAVFLRNEEALIEKLLALFEVGTLVSRGGQTYRVAEVELGYAMLVSLDTGRLRCVDLMTPAGTYRHGMIHEWERAQGPSNAPSNTGDLTSATAA